MRLTKITPPRSARRRHKATGEAPQNHFALRLPCLGRPCPPHRPTETEDEGTAADAVVTRCGGSSSMRQDSSPPGVRYPILAESVRVVEMRAHGMVLSRLAEVDGRESETKQARCRSRHARASRHGRLGIARGERRAPGPASRRETPPCVLQPSTRPAGGLADRQQHPRRTLAQAQAQTVPPRPKRRKSATRMRCARPVAGPG